MIYTLNYPNNCWEITHKNILGHWKSWKDMITMPDQLEIIEEIMELLSPIMDDNDYHNFDYVRFTY